MMGCPLLDSEYAARQNGKRLPCERMSEEIERLRTQVNQLEGQCYGMDGMSASAKIRTLQLMNVLLREENGRLQIESGKFRELVRDMHRAICGLVVLGDDYAGEYEDELCALDDRMRELGVDA